MVKVCIVFLALLLSFSFGHAQAKSDRERANLKGSVKTVRERSYSFMGPEDHKKDDKDSRKFDSGDTVTYDPSGNEIERIMVSDYGELMGKQTQTFDASGQLKETIFTNPKGVVQEKSVYVYEAGRIVEISTYDAKSVLRERTKRIYNSMGKLSEESYLDLAIARAKTVFLYDKDGNAVEMAFFLANGQKAYAPVGPCLGAHRVTYTYDGNGRPATKAIFETDGKVKKSWIYTYDQHGNQLRTTIKSGGTTTVYEYRYEFDPVGNWTRSAVTSDDSDDNLLELMLKATGEKATPEQLREMNARSRMTRVTTREITYY